MALVVSEDFDLFIDLDLESEPPQVLSNLMFGTEPLLCITLMH